LQIFEGDAPYTGERIMCTTYTWNMLSWFTHCD